jgi:hypothetical protein
MRDIDDINFGEYGADYDYDGERNENRNFMVVPRRISLSVLWVSEKQSAVDPSNVARIRWWLDVAA